MNTRRFVRVSLVVVPVLLLLGCLTSPQGTEDVSTAEPASFPSVEPAATRQPTPVPSPTTTPRPTANPRPPRTPSPTPTQTPTATPLPFPTLEPEEMQAFIAEMLAANGGCELPCWWGITPGVTPWEDVQQQFLSYGESISSWSWDADEWGTGHRTGLLGRRESYPFDYVVEHVFYEQEGAVSLIGALGHVPGWPADEWSLSPRFVQDWERYTLDQVLASSANRPRCCCTIGLKV